MTSSLVRLARPAVASLLALAATAGVAQEPLVVPFDGRDMLVHLPSALPAPGTRALVVVLHGGLGNARRIASRQSENGLNLDAVADRNGFVVAYLNGTPVTRNLGARMLGWNAGGGCCGQPTANGVDDVAYISGAVDALATRYGIDRARVFAIGHSNGAAMAQRLVCKTPTFAAVVAVSGPLNLAVSSCPSARGRRVLAIHGADDENVPVAGGAGRKGFAVSRGNRSSSHDRSSLTRVGPTPCRSSGRRSLLRAPRRRDREGRRHHDRGEERAILRHRAALRSAARGVILA